MTPTANVLPCQFLAAVRRHLKPDLRFVSVQPGMLRARSHAVSLQGGDTAD